MFSRLTRLPLRRCLHSAPPRSKLHYNSIRFALSASATLAGTYLAWSSTFAAPIIALDSAEGFPSTEKSVSNLPPPSVVISPEPLAARSLENESDTTSPTPDATNPSPEEQAADPGGAFNPATGEINWDCPCLGGMAHGPCGPQFREAFSCFIFSDEEPKGINCVDKFQAMQNCFRQHPEIYGDELMDEDDDQETASPSEPTEVPASA